MWTHDDERWDDEIISGMTFREANREFGGLSRYSSRIDFAGITESDFKRVKEACVARRKHGNAPPINFRPITEKEAAQSLFTYSPILSEYRQLHPWDEETDSRLAHGKKRLWPWEMPGYEGYVPPKGKYHRDGAMIAARLFYMSDGTGWAMSSSYWDEKVLWYMFGCDHEWGAPPEGSAAYAKSKRLFRCEHLYYCVKCSHWHTVDSSD
jgi:hypothetical protein